MKLLQVFIAFNALAQFSMGRGDVHDGAGHFNDFLSRLELEVDLRAAVCDVIDASGWSQDRAELQSGGQARVACQVGRIVFGSSLYTNLSMGYEDIADDNWSTTCQLTPQCIIQPQSTLEVSKALLIASFFKVKFSVRSGGHNPNVGFSNIGSEGILLDLSRLDEVSISKDGASASLGPGNRWGRVYDILSSNDRAAVGARANDIGVGGFLLGGGLSYWSSIYGLAFTKVRNYEVVLGNSSIVNANATFNQDLWWGLKGGGANLGIVTRFDIETIDNNQIWFEGLTFDPSQHEKLLQASVDFATAAEHDMDASATLNIATTGGAVYLAYNKPTRRPKIFDIFYAIPHQSLIPSTIGSKKSYHDAVSSLNGFGSLRVAISVHDRRWDTVTLLDHYARYLEVAADVENRFNASLYFAPQLFTKSAVRATEAREGSPIGLSSNSHCFLEIMITWKDSRYDDEAAQAIVDLGSELHASGQSLGTDLNFYYMNDAGHQQDVLRTYAHLQKLRSVSRLYDKDQVFQHLQHGGFLLNGVQ